ncbi:MAG: hypothetical protein OXN84_16140 [Albidovulum sp.]|nr:hypothetical protein [Albidovulum sp.]
MVRKKAEPAFTVGELPVKASPEDIAKVDALIKWLEAAPPISEKERRTRARIFRESTRIDWIGLRKANLTIEEAVANERTDLVGKRMLIAMRNKSDGAITRGDLSDIGTTPWPISDIYSRNHAEFKQSLREVDQDLGIQCDFVRTFFSRHFQIGEIGVTYYVWRVFVLLRKAKELERELGFLRAVCRHKTANVCPEYRMIKLAAQLEKKGIVSGQRSTLPVHSQPQTCGSPSIEGVRQARLDFARNSFNPDAKASLLCDNQSERAVFETSYRMEYQNMKKDPKYAKAVLETLANQ